MKDLVLSGFVKAYEPWDFKNPTRNTKNTRYRISDNYLRFYLKQIEPNIKKIKSKLFKVKSIDEIKNYEAILGYQFENIILNNIVRLMDLLQISREELINWCPYFQYKTSKQKACQIDILIQT
ncbi:MAG TPA: hypothetical protein PLJ21_12870, partial [Pseudobdellovibrionaceae bacterium]|nr:hypothetical protein [Pseudobdellovibrionaceae bacterium]